MEQVGTIEILRQRVYTLDPEMAHHETATTVVVEPGTFGLFSDGFTTRWLMTGRINTGRINRMGDGMFAMSGHDAADGLGVVFPSRAFGIDEWANFCAEPAATDGHPDQRVRVRLNEPVSGAR